MTNSDSLRNDTGYVIVLASLPRFDKMNAQVLSPYYIIDELTSIVKELEIIRYDAIVEMNSSGSQTNIYSQTPLATLVGDTLNRAIVHLYDTTPPSSQFFILSIVRRLG